MLAFLVCLLRIVASVSEQISENYVLNIDHNTLKEVRLISDTYSVMNLSDRNLLRLETDVFDYVLHVESIDLSYNRLTSLPEFIFSNLIKLKRISLSNNCISSLRNLFVGLKNLQVLDISRNPITHLRKGSLFGLPKSARILTDENQFERFSTDMSSDYLFENEKLEWKTRNTTISNTVNKDEIERMMNDAESPNAMSSRVLHKNSGLKFCKSDGFVITLDALWKNELLVTACVSIDVQGRQIDLRDQNITGFREDWYRLHFLPINLLDLSNNRIADIEKETLNNLPAGLRYLNFQNNQIRKIRSHVIENHHLRRLNLKNNLVEEIEDNAFANTKLKDLDLSENQMKSLNFVSTLPDTMTIFIANRNNITSIPKKAFSRLSSLIYLILQENKIQKLQNDVFQNLISLQTLILDKNNIATIEPAAFKSLTALKVLDLSNNKIVKILFTDLPRTLENLFLDFNEIRTLEKDSFVEAPTIILTLIGNNISSIARGAFNLPNLTDLYLDRNNLTTIDGDSYEGLGRLNSLWLTNNQISEIRKGSCKNLQSLYLLNIAYNPFQKLEAGALYGLSSDVERKIYIYGNKLKEMQVGLFDDT